MPRHTVQPAALSSRRSQTDVVPSRRPDQGSAAQPTTPRMADVFSKSKRSEVMSRIRAHGNTATELALISFFKMHGITGWRRRQPLFGKPDLVFRKHKVAVFVDGCFWHGCPTHGTRPKSNAAFWTDKIQRNISRDRLVNATLRSAGWRVLRIWQHELRRKNARRLESKFQRFITSPV